MSKHILLLILILAMAQAVAFGEKVAELKELGKPRSMAVDKTRLYIGELASVLIYSLEDYKFIKKFGQKGQGPQEFQVLPHIPIGIDASTDKLVVTSMRKISYFTKQGEFINEVKAVSQALRLRLFNDKFMGWSQSRHEGVLYNTICIFDNRLNKIKEIYRIKDPYQGPGKGYRVLPKSFSYHYYDNKIVLPGDDDKSINVFDTDMNKLFTITVDQEPRKVDAAVKESLTHYFKTSYESKNIYERMLKPLIFPDVFPVVDDFFVDDGFIYVMTAKEVKGGDEFFIYDMKGKFVKRMIIPIKYEREFSPFPTMVKNGKLYQLVENDAGDGWELHVSSIK